eukprot:CAMPEP_0197037520 /NCGR_PEP_ID=MMETSP1384-20130603/14713_1 /TAXON_ID=29189 /ORGANISM="Ammonia sp." /LENGTH=215 /DNA_ID=CAMNT_0042467833 /DNA_START=21 /DNA_END=668 /DNA_ORIENTATION=+
MAPTWMRGMKNMDRAMSNTKALLYFVGLLYPVGVGCSLYYAFKGPSHSFHAHGHAINILERSEEIQRNRKHIIDEVLNAYNSRPNRDSEKVYAPDATFEDPLIYMKGRDPITAMIHGLPLLTREFKTDSDTIEHYEDAIVIKHNVTLQISNMYRQSFAATQYLVLNEENTKITKHVDMWNNKELFDFGFYKSIKYINGNWIARVLFGVPSGRFFE